VNGLGPTSAVTGTLTADEDVRIDGRVNGTVTVKEATLTLGAAAHIKADVHGTRVIVHGTVRGSIVATERIELAATATVTGSLSAIQVVLVDGAQFDGAIDMSRRTAAIKVAQYRQKT